MSRASALNVEVQRDEDPKSWEDLLASEGMPPELSPIAAEYLAPLPPRRERHRLATLIRRVHSRREDASEYFTATADYLHANDWTAWPTWHHTAWDMHCEGATHAEIAAAFGTPITRAQNCIAFHVARMKAEVTSGG